MELRYKIYPDRKLSVDVLKGEINVESIMKVLNAISCDKNFKDVEIAITNLRDANLNVSVNDFDRYLVELKKDPKSQNIRWAILTSNPGSTAFSMMINQDPMFADKVAVFSTLKAVNNFLGIHYKEGEFDDADFICLT